MSKAKYGNSNLHMTTREFADLVIEALEEQNYFKKDDVAHPQDIAYAFTVVGETIGSALYWAIQQEHKFRLQPSTVSHATQTKVSPNVTVTYTSSAVSDNVNEYSEWKHAK